MLFTLNIFSLLFSSLSALIYLSLPIPLFWPLPNPSPRWEGLSYEFKFIPLLSWEKGDRGMRQIIRSGYLYKHLFN
jgi:hypothetical protein